MKNYIGVRIVKAEPEERNGKKGYRVVGPNGNQTWAPKEDFEKEYRVLNQNQSE